MIIVTPLHHHYSPIHLDAVTEEMRQRGAPRIRAHLDVATGAWMALEGTHRLRAAQFLCIAPVLVPVAWPRSQAALVRARHAARIRGFVFPRVDVESRP